MSFVTCGADLPDHIEQDCNDFPKGGSPSLAILKPNHGITDFTSATQWQAAIDAGTVRVVNRVKAFMPEPSEVKSSNPVACGADEILDGFDWTFEWNDANVNVANDDFYSKLNINTAAFAFYNCDTNKIRLVNENVTYSARPMFPASNKEYQQYHVIASWSTGADEFPVQYTAPTGIFGTGE
jgi:hypothetical protein